MKCPGQDTQYWNQDAIFETQCPECGHPMEFFKDDATRRCGGCGKKIVNPKMDFGCAAYCKFAEQCLGTLPEEFVAQRDDLFKDRVAVEMKRYLGTDFKRIGHAGRVARYAERIGKAEKINLPVVLCAAYLAGVEKKAAENGENGTSVARGLLEKLGASGELVDAVCELMAANGDETSDARVLKDADMLANMADCQGKDGVDAGDMSEKIDRLYLTDAGRQLAKETLL